MNLHTPVSSWSGDYTPAPESAAISPLQTVFDFPSSSHGSLETATWLKIKKQNFAFKAAAVPGMVTTSIIGDPFKRETPGSLRSASFASFRTETVLGDDDRMLANPQEDPFRKICALRIKARTGAVFVGTAWFISSRVLATAGHCVYLHDEGGWPEQITVMPFLDGDESKVTKYISTKFHSSEGWVNERNSDHDYGVIVLDEDAGNQTGWFSFASFPDDHLTTSIVNICGYPLDRDRATRQYIHGRKLVRTSGRRIYYDIDTFGGQSGCPAYLKLADGKVYVIGLHTYGGATSNYGTRINAEVFDNFKNWKNNPL